MRKIKAAIAGILALFAAATATAQTFPSLPSSTVIGRTAIGTGPSQAIPFSQLLALMLSSPLTVSQVNVNSIVYAGSSSGTATVSAQAVAGTAVIKWPNTSGTVATTGTTPIALSATTGAVSCPTCVVGTASSTFIASTRAAAIATNLSSYSVVRTTGYATAGDGGSATFKKVSSTPFQDSVILTGSITNAGSAYTVGTYYAVTLSGGTCSSTPEANIVVAAGVISTVTFVNGIGSGCTAGDVLTTSNGNIGGTGSGFTYTVSTVSTPVASFTDSAGTHWQYVPEGNFIDVRQFGAKFDWNGTDGSATNDFASIQAALYFAGRKTTGARIDQGGSAGTTVLLPKGAALVCGSLIVQNSTMFRGQGVFNTSLKLCDSGLAASSHFVQICDSNVHAACFGAKVMDMTLYSTASAASNNNIAMLFSNNVQQTTAIEHVAVYAGLRSCFRYTNGYGGAAKVDIYDFFCTLFTASTNDGITIDPTTTVNISFNGGLIIEAGGGGYAGNAVVWASGNLFINGFHTEGVVTGILVNATVATYQGTVHDASGGSGCTELVKLLVTNTVGNFVVGTSQKNGCTRLVTDGQPAGANQAADQVLEKVFNP